MTITEHFKRFQYFDFETDFQENENLFQKNSKIENALFPYVISEANVKTNKMVTTKWTYQKESFL